MGDETLVLDDAERELQDPDGTMRRAPGGRNVELPHAVQEGIVCRSCWQVHPPGDPDQCAVCARPRPAKGWSTMPFRLKHRYNFIRLLGRGGQGAVFLSEDLEGSADSAGRRPLVAVKVVQTTGGKEAVERLVAMFEHEVAVAPLLGRSPYFVTTYSYDMGGAPYLVMECVPWPTLQKLLKAGPLSPARTARLGVALLEAVEVMHYFRVVHRDLKPSNVFALERDEDYQIKIADLGVWTRDHEADLPDSLPADAPTFAGTLAYMSPEQMEFAQAGARSDLHAVGSILWRACSGKLPFPVKRGGLKEQIETRRTAVRRIPPRPASVPEGLYDILRRALAFNADDRYPTAREMTRELREFLRDWARGGEERKADIGVQLEAVLARMSELAESPHVGPHTARLEKLKASVMEFRGYLDEGGEIDLGVFNRAMSSVRRQLSEIADSMADPYAQQQPDGGDEAGISQAEALSPTAHRATADDARPAAFELGDRYEVLGLLGTGSLGRVYEARHKELGARLAVKLLNRSPGPGLTFEQQRRIFLAQARAASRLEHPSSIRTFDVGGGGGETFCVMEYLAGETLSHRIKTNGAFSELDALIALAPVCGALVEAHERGIVHNNLKTARIAFKHVPGLGEVPKLFGFGLVQDEIDTLLPAGLIFGTPRYMAPEQLMGAPAAPVTDLYAFGTVLYTTLMGHGPFTETGLRALVAAKVQTNAPMLPEIGPRGPISRETRAVVMALLARDPSRRTQDASPVVGWLQAIVDGRPGAVPAADLISQAMA